MAALLDVGTSLLATVSEQGRGVLSRGHRQAPAEPLELYDMEGCPFCRRVREALTELDLDVMVYPCPKGGSRYRPLVSQLGGRSLFPYLIDPNTDTALYESADIIDYLYATYSDRPAPWRGPLLNKVALAGSFGASLARPRRGLHARPARLAEQPLELYSFEASPFARRVRERLTELELPFLVRQCGRDQAGDWLLPAVRERLMPDYRPTQRHRLELWQRTGRVAIPFLHDPNTGAELFESGDILRYLDQTYAQ